MIFIKLNKGQTAIEFMIIIGFMLFVFTAFFMAIQISTSDKIKEEQTLRVKEIVLDVQNEIDLAFQSSDGYSREFRIPSDINGRGYQINIIEGLVFLITDDEKNAIALPVKNVTGNVNIPDNIIKKENGIILLNVG